MFEKSMKCIKSLKYLCIKYRIAKFILSQLILVFTVFYYYLFFHINAQLNNNTFTEI